MTIYRDLVQLGLFDNLTTAAGYRRNYTTTLAYLKPGSSALDWGCGNGSFTYFLLRNGMQVTGYNVDDWMRTRAADFKRQWPSQYTYVLSNDPRELPFAPGTFDAVFSNGVLEHVRETGGDELTSLRELSRVLKPDGRLFCFHLPRKYSWIENLAKAINLRQYRHTYLYSTRDVRRLLEESGFRLVEIGCNHAIPRTMVSRLPRFIKNSRIFCAGYNAADNVLTALLPFLTQNIYFVAERK